MPDKVTGKPINNAFYDESSDMGSRFQNWLSSPAKKSTQESAPAAQPRKPLGQEINENLGKLQENRKKLAEQLYNQGK